MLSRRSLLRLMIGCLAFTALTGVAGVFIGGWDLIGRLAGTAFAGAITALIMLRASSMMDSVERYRAGHFTMWLALAQFALAFAAIWASWLDTTLQIQLGWHIWGTLFAVIATGWPAAKFVEWMDRPSTRIASRVAISLDTCVFMLLFAAVWTSEYSVYSVSERFFKYAAVVAGLGLVVFANLVAFRPGDTQWWRWIGVAASSASAAIFCYGIWADLGGEPTIPITFGFVGLGLAHQNLMFLVPLKGKQNIIRNLTVGFTALTLVCVDYILWHKYDDAELLTRFAVATGILAVCGTLTMLVLAKLNGVPKVDVTEKGTDEADADTALPKKIAFTCPVCAKAHTSNVGDSACDGCGLLFTITLATPRCKACGFSLLHSKADACPEYGAKITTAVPIV